MNLGEKIIHHRKKEGMTQEDLANQLEVSRQTVSKWELSQSTPELGYIIKLSDLFNVTTDYLIKDEYPEKSVKPQSSNTETTSSNSVTNETADIETTNTVASNIEATNINAVSSEISHNQDAKKVLLPRQIVGIILTSLGGLFTILGIILSAINQNWIISIWLGVVVMILGLELLIIKRNPTLIILWTLWSILSMPSFLIFRRTAGNPFNLSTAGGIGSCISLGWFIILVIISIRKLKKAKKTNKTKYI